MARPRSRETAGLPQNLVCRKRARKNGKTVYYYFYTLADGKEKSLGKDKHKAVLEAAKLNIDSVTPSAITTFVDIVARFNSDIMIDKKISTQYSYKRAIKQLLLFFGNPPAPLTQIEPHHVSQYLQWRKSNLVSANVEVSVFSAIWNYAREIGLTSLPNPAQGVRKHRLKKRDIYIEDNVFNAVYAVADQDLKDLMDLAYLIGQRPVDLVQIHLNDIQDNVLTIAQKKTGAKVRFAIKGKLATIIKRRMAATENWLFKDRRNNPLSRNTLTRNFASTKAIAMQKNLALKDDIAAFQFRDLRAKAGTDKSLADGDEAARKQLGHTSLVMTKRYIRKTPIIDPTK